MAEPPSPRREWSRATPDLHFGLAYSVVAVSSRSAGTKRRLITAIPLPDMLSRLLRPSIGRQIRRTVNTGSRCWQIRWLRVREPAPRLKYAIGHTLSYGEAIRRSASPPKAVIQCTNAVLNGPRLLGGSRWAQSVDLRGIVSLRITANTGCK